MTRTRFISDALVNNQMLGLTSNERALVTEFDPRMDSAPLGFQQSNVEATNLSDSFYTLSEGWVIRLRRSLPEDC